MNRSMALKASGVAIMAAALWTAVVAFVGPTFGYGMPPGADVAAWDWNASHFQRHVLPGLAGVIGGALLLTGSRGTLRIGALLALAAGIWMIINPFVVRAWLEGGGGGGGDASTTMQIITPLGYHYVPGIIAVAASAFALGRLFPGRAAHDEDRAGQREDRRFERTPERAPADRTSL